MRGVKYWAAYYGKVWLLLNGLFGAIPWLLLWLLSPGSVPEINFYFIVTICSAVGLAAGSITQFPIMIAMGATRRRMFITMQALLLCAAPMQVAVFLGEYYCISRVTPLPPLPGYAPAALTLAALAVSALGETAGMLVIRYLSKVWVKVAMGLFYGLLGGFCGGVSVAAVGADFWPATLPAAAWVTAAAVWAAGSAAAWLLLRRYYAKGE